jgi:hypothetical protein
MNLRIILGIVSFSVAMVGCLAANMTYFFMVAAINETRPRDRQLEHFGFGTKLRFFDDLNEYRVLYPCGRLRPYFRIAVTTMIVGWAATAACLMLRFQ